MCVLMLCVVIKLCIRVFHFHSVIWVFLRWKNVAPVAALRAKNALILHCLARIATLSFGENRHIDFSLALPLSCLFVVCHGASKLFYDDAPCVRYAA